MEASSKFEEFQKAVYKKIPQVKLDSQGVFKYILITASFGDSSESAVLEFVRGFNKFEYHKEIFKDFKAGFKGEFQVTPSQKVVLEKEMSLSCPGGGRINHDASKKRLTIYGYSQSYGQGNHDHVVSIMKKHMSYPESNWVVSYDGY